MELLYKKDPANGLVIDGKLVYKAKTMAVEIPLGRANIFQKMTKQDVARFVVKVPPLGVLEKIGVIGCSITKPKEEEIVNLSATLLDRIASDASAHINILACLLECSSDPSSRTRQIISDNLTPGEMNELLFTLLEFADLQAFMQTTILMKGMSLSKRKRQESEN